MHSEKYCILEKHTPAVTTTHKNDKYKGEINGVKIPVTIEMNQSMENDYKDEKDEKTEKDEIEQKDEIDEIEYKDEKDCKNYNDDKNNKNNNDKNNNGNNHYHDDNKDHTSVGNSPSSNSSLTTTFSSTNLPLYSPGRLKGPFFVKCLVNDSVAGSLIGRNGTEITNIQEDTGCNIRLSAHRNFFPHSSWRIVLASGAPQDVHKALKIIISKTRERLITLQSTFQNHQVSPNGSNESINNGNNNGNNGNNNGNIGNNNGNNNSNNNGYNTNNGNNDNTDNGNNNDDDDNNYDVNNLSSTNIQNLSTSTSISTISPTDNKNNENITTNKTNNKNTNIERNNNISLNPSVQFRIVAPKSAISGLIGTGGQTVKEIQQRTKTRIQISQREDGSNERIVTVSGIEKDVIIASIEIVNEIQNDKNLKDIMTVMYKNNSLLINQNCPNYQNHQNCPNNKNHQNCPNYQNHQNCLNNHNHGQSVNMNNNAINNNAVNNHNNINNNPNNHNHMYGTDDSNYTIYGPDFNQLNNANNTVKSAYTLSQNNGKLFPYQSFYNTNEFTSNNINNRPIGNFNNMNNSSCPSHNCTTIMNSAYNHTQNSQNDTQNSENNTLNSQNSILSNPSLNPYTLNNPILKCEIMMEIPEFCLRLVLGKKNIGLIEIHTYTGAQLDVRKKAGDDPAKNTCTISGRIPAVHLAHSMLVHRIDYMTRNR